MPAQPTELWEYMIERLRAYFLDSGSAGGVAGVDHRNVRRRARELAGVAARISPRGSRRSRNSSRWPKPRVSRPPTSASPTSSRRRTLVRAGAVDVDGAARARREGIARSARGHRRRGRARARQARLQPKRSRVSRPCARRSTAFFDNVMVNAEDPVLRRNRLALLAQLRHHFHAHRGPVLPAGLMTRD